MAVVKASAKAKRFADETNARLGKRLRFLRESLGMDINEMKSLSGSSLTNYELHDISTFKLGDFVSLANEFSMTPVELMGFLFNDETPAPAEPERTRLLSYFNQLDLDQKSVAAALVRTLATHKKLEVV